MTTHTAYPDEEEALTRAAIWAIVAGVEPDIEPDECGEWQPQVAMLLGLLKNQGQKSAATEYENLMMNNLDLATVMATGHASANGSGHKRILPLVNLTARQAGSFLSHRADDEGNADCLYEIYGDQFLYCDTYDFMFWTGTHWDNENAEALLQQAAVYTLRKRQEIAAQNARDGLIKFCAANASRVRACIEMFRKKVTVSVGDFDSSPRLLNCANGVVDLASGRVTPHDPLQRFTYCLDVAFDPNASSRLWLEFLDGVIAGGPEMVDYLQRATGYSLTGFTREECLFYVHGPTRSGKGTFSETLLALMPRPLAVEVDFNTFTASRDHDTQNFDLAPLKPARLIFASESNKYQVLNSAKIKALTGGDEVRCAFKHRDHFEYKPQYKVWLLSNLPVNADVDDDAAWGRVRVIEFPNSFLGKEDKTLKWRMRSPENLQGVLAWAVEGAIKWHASSQGLIAPRLVKEATQRHRDEADYVAQWLEECANDNPIAFEANPDVYSSYKMWCIDNGVTPKHRRGLTESIKAKGYLVNQQKKDGNGRNRRGVIGFRLI